MIGEGPFRREQVAVVLTLAILTAAAWVLTLSQMRDMAAMDGMAMMSSPMQNAASPVDAGGVPGQAGMGDMEMESTGPMADGPSGPNAEPGVRMLVFLGMWTTMMAAMMLPAATPMILTFGTVYRRKREQGDVFIPTWVFGAGYLLVWSAFGVGAYVLGVLGQNLAPAGSAPGGLGPRVAALAMLAAAIYQLTPLKQRCLAHCRSPLAFVMHHWRQGVGGALRMGAEHGLYCVGCCWVLFLLLVAVGLASLPWMGLITLIVLAEKILPRWRLVSTLVAVVLLGLSLLAFAQPSLIALAEGGASGTAVFRGS
jgi:predicted metal-binding membrane protein